MERATELKLDDESGCLLQVVALFANDGAELMERRQVPSTQRHFSYLLFRWVDWDTGTKLLIILHRFLIDRDGEEAAREAIPKYISMLSRLR